MAWNRESKRHAKAAKGISTRKDTRSSMAQASSNPKIQSAMTDKQYAQEEIKKYKNGHKPKVITVDLNNEASIKQAERRKAMLENQGYKQNKTEQLGLEIFRFEYIK